MIAQDLALGAIYVTTVVLQVWLYCRIRALTERKTDWSKYT